MSNITYIYGSMNAGKSAQAIMLAHSINQQGKKVKLYKVYPDREGVVASNIKSRNGTSYPGALIGPDYSFSSFIMSRREDVDIIIVDECQFLSKEQVDYLVYCSKVVFFVGLKTNYLGDVFESVQRILSYEPSTVEIPSICSSPNCLEKATHNLLQIDGKIVKHGNDKLVGDIEGTSIKYSPVCKMHYCFNVVTKEELNNMEVNKCK